MFAPGDEVITVNGQHGVATGVSGKIYNEVPYAEVRFPDGRVERVAVRYLTPTASKIFRAYVPRHEAAPTLDIRI